MTRVERGDIDEIIAIAARQKQARASQLTLEDLQDVAAELDIPAEYVADAVVELERRRQEEEKESALRKSRQQTLLAAAGVVLVVLLLFSWVSHAQLKAEFYEVQQQRAQVVNVLDRQAATLQQWQNAPESVERTAEIAGAQNRVSLERQRYDEAATRYNQRASGFPATLWVRLFGHPDRLPLSNETDLTSR